MTEKTITLCGQQVKLLYCAAAENGFEDLSGKSISEMDFTKNQDILRLSIACIIAAYTRDGQEPPIKSEDLLYEATPKELTDLYLTVITMRNEWYGVNQVLQKQLDQEAAQMTDEEREEASKNAPAPTTDTASS